MAFFYSDRRLTVAGHVACMAVSVLLTPACAVLALVLYMLYSVCAHLLLQRGYIMPLIQDLFVGLELLESPNTYINGGYFMEDEVDVEVLRRRIDLIGISATDEYGHKIFPKFTRTLHRRFGFLVWREDPKFDVTNHIWGERLESSGDPVRDELELETVLNAHYNRMMGEDKPNWEMIVIHLSEGWRKRRPYDLDILPRSIVVLRFQHCMMDGLSLTRFCSEVVANDGAKVPEAMKRMLPKWNPRENGPVIAMLRHLTACVASIAVAPYIGVRSWVEMDNTFLQRTPVTQFKRYSWGNVLSMDKIKAIKNATGTTVNDVVMSCVAAAVSRLFAERGEKAPAALNTVMPVSTQRLDRPVRMHNDVLGAFVQMCTKPDMDPVARLRRTRVYTNAAKSSPMPIAYSVIASFMSRVLPGPIMRQLVWPHSPSVIYSCVPGPDIGVHYAYHRVLQLIAFVPNCYRNVLSFSCISYCNSATVNVTMDSSICSDMQQARDVIRYVEEEFERLLDALSLN